MKQFIINHYRGRHAVRLPDAIDRGEARYVQVATTIKFVIVAFLVPGLLGVSACQSTSNRPTIVDMTASESMDVSNMQLLASQVLFDALTLKATVDYALFVDIKGDRGLVYIRNEPIVLTYGDMQSGIAGELSGVLVPIDYKEAMQTLNVLSSCRIDSAGGVLTIDGTFREIKILYGPNRAMCSYGLVIKDSVVEYEAMDQRPLRCFEDAFKSLRIDRPPVRLDRRVDRSNDIEAINQAVMGAR